MACISNKITHHLRPLDTRSTVPVLARVLARAWLEVFVVLVRKMKGRRIEDRPAKGFSKKNPKPKKRIDWVGWAGPHSNASERNWRRAGVKDFGEPARDEARATTVHTLNPKP